MDQGMRVLWSFGEVAATQGHLNTNYVFNNPAESLELSENGPIDSDF